MYPGPGKTLRSIYETLERCAECSDNKVIYCTEIAYQQIKHLPESFMRGRWLYIRYKGKVFSIRKVKI